MAAATDVIVTEEDCRTNDGREWTIARKAGETVSDYSQRIRLILLGRITSEAVNFPANPSKMVLLAGTEVDEKCIGILAQLDSFRIRARSVLTCKSADGVCAKCYGWDSSKRKQVQVGAPVGIIAAQSIGEPGTQLTMRTFHTGGVATDNGDITGGLPQVEKLVDASRPLKPAMLAKISGVVSEERSKRGDLLLVITNVEGKRTGHKLPRGERLLVASGDSVVAGQRLTNGDIDPQEFFAAIGPLKYQEWLVEQVQKTYEIQGVTINPKHFEIIARLMITREPHVLQNAGSRNGSQSGPVKLQGITRAARSARSFLAGASFQGTAKKLAEAAVMGQRDDLRGIRECVISGKLIPAGTGFIRPA